MFDRLPWWVWALGVGGVGYLLYKQLSKVPAAVNAATGSVAQGIADLWLSLPFVSLPPSMTVLGNALLPDGSQVPLSSLQSGQIRSNTDSNGNLSVYANVRGTIYQLNPSNAQGNFPATLVGAAPAGA